MKLVFRAKKLRRLGYYSPLQRQQKPMLTSLPKHKVSEKTIRKALEENILFNHCTQTQIDLLVQAMQPKKVRKGQKVIIEGTTGESLYVVQKGRVGVLLKNGKEVELKVESVFGELSLMFESPRQATVIAREDCELWSLDRSQFRMIMDKQYEVQKELVLSALKESSIIDLLPIKDREKTIRILAEVGHFQQFKPAEEIVKQGAETRFFYVILSGEVLVQLNNSSSDPVLRKGDYFGESSFLTTNPRNATIRARTPVSVLVLDEEAFSLHLASKNFLIKLDENADRRIFLCAPLMRKVYEEYPEQFDKIAKEIRYTEYKKEDLVLQEGKEAVNFYVIKEGQVRIEKKIGDDELDVVARLGKGAHFGESMLKGEKAQKRDATVVVDSEKLETFSVSKDTFNKYFTPEEQKSLLVESGRRKETKRPVRTKLTLRERQTSVKLSKQSFQLREPSLAKKVKNVKLKIKKKWLQRECAIGQGSFGTVFLASLKSEYNFTSDEDYLAQSLHGLSSAGGYEEDVVYNTTSIPTVFALKRIAKKLVIEKNQVEAVTREKNILQQANHPFILQLYETYQDSNCIYMLLEFVQGGELFNRIVPADDSIIDSQSTSSSNSVQAGIPEPDARFYGACVIDALCYLHDKSIAYRDLKPENLMIDVDGYIKVIDFGFAKQFASRDAKSSTTCGTYEYMAPEILLQKWHTRAVDYWAFGVLMYEMLTGYSPFAKEVQKRRDRFEESNEGDVDSQSTFQMALFRNIIKGKYIVPKGFSKELKGLVKMLLEVNARKRLGMNTNLSPGKGIKEHKFFASITWGDLRRKVAKAPWKPEVQDKMDLANFRAEDFGEDVNHVEEYDNLIDPLNDPFINFDQ
eukprot:augustus_masked-scaffold_44-processed-gene-1.113-mRNA-1 protein AED:0.05 eAED:0.05 QI:0/-1/0/1/-1/1/1/0/859